MILREAKATDDLLPLLNLAKASWSAGGFPYREQMDGDARGERFRAMVRSRSRIILLYEGERLLAALGAHPLETDRGQGYEVTVFVVDPTLSADKRLELLDAASLQACNIALSEGRRVVMSRPFNAEGRTLYGSDKVGMTYGAGYDGQQWGDALTINAAILERHPEWARSLSSMTVT